MGPNNKPGITIPSNSHPPVARPRYRSAVYGQRYGIKMNKIAYIIFLISLTLVVAGCKNDGEEKIISVSVSASFKDGTVEYSDLTKQQRDNIDFLRQKFENIDKEFPGPSLNPYDLGKLELYKIESVNDRGEIFLKNASAISLEGLNCEVTTRNFLRDFLSTDTDRIVFIPSSETHVSPLPVYAWHASLMLMEEPELKSFIRSPSFSSLNEAALLSGWCKVKGSASNKYHDRYIALEKLFYKMEQRKNR